MMSGNNFFMARSFVSRLIVLPLVLCAGVTITPAHAADTEQDAAPWSLAELMHDLAQVKKAKATFIERKHLSMLTNAADVFWNARIHRSRPARKIYAAPET